MQTFSTSPEQYLYTTLWNLKNAHCARATTELLPRFQNSFHCNCILDIRQIGIRLITACGKCASVIWSYQRRHWQMATAMSDDMIRLGPLCSQSLLLHYLVKSSCFKKSHKFKITLLKKPCFEKKFMRICLLTILVSATVYKPKKLKMYKHSRSMGQRLESQHVVTYQQRKRYKSWTENSS